MLQKLAFACLMIVLMSPPTSAGVETFTSEDGRFTILFPDKPKIAQQVIPLPIGNVTANIHTAQFPKQTGDMVVTYTDYPAQILVKKKPDQILDDSVNGTIQGMKATLVKSGPITQNDAPGREFSWTVAGPTAPLKGRARIFLVGPRLYQILIVGPEKSLAPDVFESIFKSFDFKPAPAAAPPAAASTTTKAATPGTMTKAATPNPALEKGSARGKTATKGRDRWITHTGVSFEGLWNVQMPMEPKHTTEPGLFGVKVRNVHVASDGKLTYTLKIQVTPDEALNDGKDSVLATARDKLAEEVHGKVVEESNAQIAGYDGHAYRIEVAGSKPAFVSARAAIVGKRTVVLWVVGDRAAVAGPSAERFLDSFRVGN